MTVADAYVSVDFRYSIYDVSPSRLLLAAVMLHFKNAYIFIIHNFFAQMYIFVSDAEASSKNVTVLEEKEVIQ